jgi:protein-S-isoprenylcysteine O-methyltransferase Ste14
MEAEMPQAQPAPVPLSRLAMQVVVLFAAIGLLMFLPAGTLAWPHAWWLSAILLISMLAAIIYISRTNPEIIAARQKIGADTKRWDLLMVSLVLVGIAAILPAGGLEIRFGGTPLPLPVILVGYAIFLAGFVLMTWAQAHNRHFEPTVRIQTDRGHAVIDTGPYAHIRHPGYISGSMFALGMALALGSAWAVVPAAFTIVMLIVRTVLEDNTLHHELIGYPEYAARVRYRWLPGVW